MDDLTLRRALLQNFACSFAAFPAVSAGELAGSPVYSNLPIGLHLYTVGGEMSQSIVGTLKRVANIGYTEVELSSSKYSTKESNVALRDLGLRTISGHYTLPELINNLHEKIDLAKEFGQSTWS